MCWGRPTFSPVLVLVLVMFVTYPTATRPKRPDDVPGGSTELYCSE